MSATHDTLGGDVESGVMVAERYRVFEKLGDGGFAAVWRARDEVTGRDVALKFLFADVRTESYRLTMFEREAAALRRLDHPAIGRAYASGRDGQRMYIVLELIAGQTLHQLTMRRWAAREQLGLAEVGEWMDTILDALAYAHEAGLVHRDLKPANIMVTGGVPPVRLLDFGVAKLMDAGDTDSATTMGRIIGTPSYLSPEQISHGRVTAQSDLFALGSLLFELVTGRKLWIRDPEDRPVDVFGIGAARKDVARNGPAAVCRRVMFEVRPRLREYRPDAPAALEALCLSLLDPIADKRPASALAARVALAHALDVPLPPPVRAAYEAALRRAAERTASQLKPDPDATPVAPWAQVAVQPVERSVAIEVSIARPAAAMGLVSGSAGASATPSAPQPGPGDVSRTEPDRLISEPAVASLDSDPPSVAPLRPTTIPASVALASSGAHARPVDLPPDPPALPAAFGPLELVGFVGAGIAVGLAVHTPLAGLGMLSVSGAMTALGWARRRQLQRPTWALLAALEKHAGFQWKRVETRGEATHFAGALLKPPGGGSGAVELVMPRRQVLPGRYRIQVEAPLTRDPSSLFTRAETPLDWSHLMALMLCEPEPNAEAIGLMEFVSRRAVQARIVGRSLRVELGLKRETTAERRDEAWNACAAALVAARWLDREAMRLRAWSEAYHA